MIISDLEHLEVVREENQVEGGVAIASSVAGALAIGEVIAGTETTTGTIAISTSDGSLAGSFSESLAGAF